MLKNMTYRWFGRNAFIPLIEILPGPKRIIHKGRFAGKTCYYKTALLNALIKLKPRVCLEIGTYFGGTTEVFKHYFQKYEPSGILITADIKRYAEVESNNTRQVIVYPHTSNITDFHNVSKEEMLVGTEAVLGNSVKMNCEILRRELEKIKVNAFDFCFIDGDHQKIAFLNDLKIAQRLTAYPHYALLDDTREEMHECAFAYKETVANEYDHYDFEDWPIFVGASLIWKSGN